MKFKRILTGTAGLSVVMCLAIANAASAATDKLPNLTPMKASGITIATTADGSKQLRFNTTSWNNGTGPLEIRGGAVDTSTSKQQVLQRIYATDGTYRDVNAGFFEYHPTHNHMHFNNYAVYTLQPVNAPGASARTGTKTTFCIMDTDKVNVKLPGAPKKAGYKTCGTSTQGMSVGWGDTYASYLDGQSIDISGLPDGDYNLNIEVDPKAQIVESNDSDNTSSVGIRIVGQTITVSWRGTRRSYGSAQRVADGLDPDDCRAWAALVFYLMISSDDPAGVLRERAEMVLTPEGRGPVHDQAGFSQALLRSARILC